MPQLPTTGQQNWGPILNDWLKQIGEENTGGINILSTDPDTTSWTTEETGYTFVNTTENSLKRWNGTSFDILLSSGSSINQYAKTTDYALTDNDTNGFNRFTNDGATQTITFTLPDAVQGREVIILNVEDQQVLVEATVGTKLYSNNLPNGVQTIGNDLKGSEIKIYAVNNTEWWVEGTFSGASDPQDFTSNTEDYAGFIQPGWKIGGGWVVQTDGTNGLIMAPENEPTTLQWKTSMTTTTGTTSTTDGAANTNAMVTASISLHPVGEACYNKDIHGFSDWFLPAKDQLDDLHIFWVGTGRDTLFGFTAGDYWSSTEINNSSAWYQTFSFLIREGSDFKTRDDFVRAVRTF